MTTKQEILNIANKVRDNLSESYGQCFPASKELKNELAINTEADKSEIEIEEVRMGPAATIRHYVVAYPARKISDTDASGRILVDITLDQYCTEYEEQGKVETSIGPKSNIPDVNLYETKEASPYK